MNTPIIITIISCIILLIFIMLYVYRIKKYNEGRVDAQNFLNQLNDVLYDKMIGVIKSFDYDNYDNLNSIEVDIINKMQSSAENYIKAEIGRHKDNLSSTIQKILDKKFINNHIEFIINKIDIFKSVEEQLGDKFTVLYEEFSKEEEKLKKDYSNESIYYINDNNIKLEEADKDAELIDSDENGLENHLMKMPSKEEESKLNPQIDEEEKLNPDDESVEILIEDEENSDYYVDNLGRFHDKSTGKFIKFIKKRKE